jgi:hypothetical protein
MAEVTGSIGSERVELNNAATEATLRAMLAAMNRQTAALSALRTGGGAPGGGGTTQATQQQTAATNQQTAATNQQTAATNQQTVATNAASKSLNALSKGAMILGGIVGDLVGGVAKTASNLTDFAGGLMDGKGGLSDFYGSLKDLPLGMGMVAGLFQKIAEMQEAELRSYRDLSKAGVNFGGSLNTIRMNALELGMTMDQYSGIIKKNQSAMAMLGGNTNTGAEAFTKMAKQLRESSMGEQLRGMGLDAEDAASGLASYVQMTGARSKDELKNTGAIAEAAGRYMKNLDALSQLTGESKEALEKKMQEEANEAQFQAYLSTLDEKGREKALAGMQEALARGGKGAAQAFKDQVQGLPPMTEAGQQFVAQSKAGSKAVNDLVANVKDSSKTVEDQKKAGDKLTFGMAQEAKAMGVANAALGRIGGAAGDVANAQARAMSQVAATGAKTEDEITAKRKEVEKAQDDLSRSAAARAAESEKAFKDMGAAIYGALQPALAMLTPIINELAQEFMSFVKSNMPAIKEAITKFATFVTNFAKDLFSEDGRKKIINDITYYMKLMLIEIKKAILPKIMYSDADAAKETAQLDAQKKAYDDKAEYARLANESAKRELTLQLDGNDAKKEAARKEIEASKQAIADSAAKLKNGEITAKQHEDLKKKEQASIDLKSDALAALGPKGKLDEEKRKKLEQDQATATAGSGKADAAMAKVREQEVKDKSNQGTLAGNVAGTAVGGGVGMAVGAIGGGSGGGVVGGILGGIIGSFAGPAGTVAGAAIGTSLGTSIGAWLGGAGGTIVGGLIGQKVGDKMSAPTEEAVRKEMADKEKKGLEKKAAGGPVKAGEPYWVGEEGPEIMVPDAAGNITPNDKLSDMQPHLANMSKSISGNFKGVASDIAASGQQQQPITLSRESIAALGKLLPLDSMSGIKQPELTKDSKTPGDMKNHMESMTKDINASLGRMTEKAYDPKKNLEKDFKDIPPISEEMMNSLMSKRMPKTKESTLPDPTAKATPVLEGKESKLTEQSKTPMLTDMLSSFAKTIMPEFMSKMPSVGDLNKKIDDIKKDPKAEMESMGKTITDGIKNVASMSPAGALLNPLMGSLGGSGSNENLLKEMQQLNKNTVELIKYTKMTLEENKSQTSKLGSLSGNLYV